MVVETRESIMLTGKRVKNEKRDGKLTWKNIALTV